MTVRSETWREAFNAELFALFIALVIAKAKPGLLILSNLQAVIKAAVQATLLSS